MSSVNDIIKHELFHLDELSRGTRAYFQARTRNRLYDLAMTKFRERRDSEGLTQADVARRMGKRPEVVNRIFSGPGNWRADTLSDLLLAIAGEEIDATSGSPLMKPPTNRRALDRDADGRPFKPPTQNRDEARKGKATEKKELDSSFSFANA